MAEEGTLDEKVKFLYERYQGVVDHFESGDLRVTFGVLAFVAGVIAVNVKQAQGAPLVTILYDWSNVQFIVPLFLYATAYSIWNRYRVLYAVARLVQLEQLLALSKPGLAYWVGNKQRPWIYVFISPWPWILLLFAIGALYCGVLYSMCLLGLWLLVMLVYYLVFNRFIPQVCTPLSGGDIDVMEERETVPGLGVGK